MSVRRRRRRVPKTGAVTETWMVDVEQRMPNGSSYPRQRLVSPVQTKRGAVEYERQVRHAILSGTFGQQRKEAKRQTLSEFASVFLESYVNVNNKPSEQTNKRWMINAHLLPALGKLRLDAIGVKQADTLKSQLKESKLSPKTINNILATLRKMLVYAMDIGELEKVPKIKLLKVPQQTFDFFSREEFERLVQAAEPDPEDHAAILFAASTGARLGELLALRWDHLDMQARMVTISRSRWKEHETGTKTGKVRTVPMTERLHQALKGISHERGPFVFCRADGSPWTKEVIRALLPRVCRKAELRVRGWHSLRHTFASHLAMGGAHLRAIQELGGWSSLAMVQRYSHLSPTHLRDAIGALERHHSGTTQKSSASPEGKPS